MNKKKWEKGIEELIKKEHEREQIEERKNQTSDDIITNNVNKPIATLANTDAQTAINYLNDTSDFLNSPIEFLLKNMYLKKDRYYQEDQIWIDIVIILVILLKMTFPEDHGFI